MNLAKGYLLGLLAVLLALSALLLEPFLQYVLAAILVAYALRPLQDRLEARTSPGIAAFALVTLAVAGILAPIAVVLVAVADDAAVLAQELESGAVGLGPIETRIEALVGAEVDLEGVVTAAARELGSSAFAQSTQVLGTVTHLVLGLALTVFLVYYLLKDGEDLVDWTLDVVAVPSDLQRELYREVDGVIWAVLFGHVLVAVVQGVVAGLGLFVTGVPNAAFWTAVMVVFAMLPIVGTIPIWGGAVAYLYLTGEPVFAAGLAVYSIVVVGLTDDYLRPFAVDRYAKLNPAVILVGILGGGYAFGVMGLFFGPVLLGALKAVARVVSEHWERLEAEGTV